jgi:hypothetical protein
VLVREHVKQRKRGLDNIKIGLREITVRILDGCKRLKIVSCDKL